MDTVATAYANNGEKIQANATSVNQDPQIHAWMNTAADANGETVKSGLSI